jgi:hypothetical protein
MAVLPHRFAITRRRRKVARLRPPGVCRQPEAAATAGVFAADGLGACLRPVDARSYATTVSHLRNLKPYAEA